MSCLWVQRRVNCDPGGIERLAALAIYQTLSSDCHVSCCARAYMLSTSISISISTCYRHAITMHPLHFTGSVSVSASYLLSSLEINVFNLELYLFFVLSFLFVVFVSFLFLWALVGALYIFISCLADIEADWQPRMFGRMLLGVVEARSVNNVKKNTHTHTHKIHTHTLPRVFGAFASTAARKTTATLLFCFCQAMD